MRIFLVVWGSSTWWKEVSCREMIGDHPFPHSFFHLTHIEWEIKKIDKNDVVEWQAGGKGYSIELGDVYLSIDAKCEKRQLRVIIVDVFVWLARDQVYITWLSTYPYQFASRYFLTAHLCLGIGYFLHFTGHQTFSFSIGWPKEERGVNFRRPRK